MGPEIRSIHAEHMEDNGIHLNTVQYLFHFDIKSSLENNTVYCHIKISQRQVLYHNCARECKTTPFKLPFAFINVKLASYHERTLVVIANKQSKEFSCGWGRIPTSWLLLE